MPATITVIRTSNTLTVSDGVTTRSATRCRGGVDVVDS